MNNPAPDIMILKRNLEALGLRSRRAVEAVISSMGREDVTVEIAPDGGASVLLGSGAAKRQLSSRRAPREEASRLCDTVDVKTTATIVVSGFGSGLHVVELARRVKKTGLVICFEPDVALLRSVLERMDYSETFEQSNVVILTEDSDRGAIADALSGFEGALAAGISMLRHPPSTPVLGERVGNFERTFTDVMKAVRTAVLTTLVQVDTTVRNLLQNVGAYSVHDGIADLHQCASGRPAVVVSAGPSLCRNLHLLKNPANRSKVVVIAVQTVLKTLLKEGIRPDFVTALDYHEISKRFYEGLNESDVEGVTLVAEAKANPAILDAYPGDKRFVGDKVLDEVLGAELAEPKGELKPGATVAHLAYYLARHMGCDPVILIGQDLAFTDNQYYAPGAAIHRVWGGELNEFNTLEMLEWQRIARMKSLLRKVPAVGGGEIYSDEQMATYLVQFERDFLEDTSRGLSVIDATEGGALKKHTVCRTFASVLEGIDNAEQFTAPRARAKTTADRLSRVKARIASLREDTEAIKSISEDTKRILEQMQSARSDAELNRLIDRARQNGAKVAETSTANRLVQYINQAGQLNRYKADRMITLDESLSPREKQKRQIERDIRNVSWLADVAAHTAGLLRDCGASLDGAPKITRDVDVVDHESNVAKSPKKVVAVLITDTAIGGLGTPRDLSAPFGGSTVFGTTLDTLHHVEGVNETVIVCRDAKSIESMIGNRGRCTVIEASYDAWQRRDRRAGAIAVARIRTPHCWRGGIANITSYDEAFFAPMVLEALKASNADAAVILGPDWCEIDPELAAKTIERYRENPERNKLTFSQAPAGKGVCVIDRGIVAELSTCDGPAATIGGLLSYQPIAPQSDPIAKPQCIQVESTLRDSLGRFIADSTARRSTTRSAAPVLWNIEIDENHSAISMNIWRSLFASLAQTIEDVSVKIDGRGVDETQVERLAGIAKSEGVRNLQVLCDKNASPSILNIDTNIISVDFGDDCSLETARHWLELFERADATNGAEMPTKWFVPTVNRSESTLFGLESWYDYWLARRGVAVIAPSPLTSEGRIKALPVPEFVLAHQESMTVTIRKEAAIYHQGREIGTLGEIHPLALLECMGVMSCELATSERSG